MVILQKYRVNPWELLPYDADFVGAIDSKFTLYRKNSMFLIENP